jgi:N-acyl-D-amino-acid deacylase
VSIARAAGVRAERYHFKQSGRPNWNKIEAAIGKVNAARAAGLEITADLYLYPASSTGLRDSLPPWARGADARKLRDARTRARIIRDMRTPTDKWSQLAALAGAGNILLVGFKTDALKPLTGMTLAEVARRRGTSPEETIMDLVSEDHSRIMAVYFTMSEDNIRREIPLPWMSFGSDGAAVTNEGVFLKSSIHPRAYGNVARLLGQYVRDDKLILLQEAIRRLTSLPAHTLRIRDRGSLEVGYFADVVVFDPATISDHATFEKPHQYATGVQHVFVNGVQVLRNGEHTGATPGRAVRGPGWTGWTVQDRSRPRAGGAR